MSKKIDLHTHSTYSDGTLSPAELVKVSHKHGAEALILSDHDSVSGCGEAAAEAAKRGLRFACGVEINTRESDVHVLGYGFAAFSAEFSKHLASFRGCREERVRRILDKLHGLGVELTYEEVTRQVKESVGRPHVADALIRGKIVRSRREAFHKFLGQGAAAYVERLGPNIQEAIAAIRDAGGWAALAHPYTTPFEGRIESWVDAGLQGIEVYYMNHTRRQIERLVEVARRYGLRMTGGSDFHGPRTGRDTPGPVEVADDVFAAIEDSLRLSEV
ncbi:MAG: PHP domain-containing protein [Elusimicrobiota bacterium]